MNRPGSLSRRLALMTSAGFVAIWLLAGLATALVLRHEQEELLDLQLRETARVFLPVLAERWAADGAAAGAPEWRMRAALMVHYLERISDHGVDIGGRTVFLVTGERMESAFTTPEAPDLQALLAENIETLGDGWSLVAAVAPWLAITASVTVSSTFGTASATRRGPVG